MRPARSRAREASKKTLIMWLRSVPDRLVFVPDEAPELFAGSLSGFCPMVSGSLVSRRSAATLDRGRLAATLALCAAGASLRLGRARTSTLASMVARPSG